MLNLSEITPEDIDLLPYPVYYLDEKRLIIRRNKNADPGRLSVHVRAKLDKYISAQDRKRVMELKVGEEIFVDLFFDSAYGALVMRLENGFLVALRNITAHMMRYVAELNIKLPTFFSNVVGQIESLRLATIHSKDELRRVRRQYYKAIRYQTCLAHYFENTSGKYRRETVSEVTTPIKTMLDVAVNKLRPNGIDLYIHMQNENSFVKASAEDVRYAVATLLSVAAENTYDGRIRIESASLEGEYLFKIIFEPRVDEQTYKGILSGYYGGEMLQSVYGNTFFDLLLVQMLAEGNHWNFNIKEDGCSRGVLGMFLYIPLSDEKPLDLNCPPDSLPLLEIMLVNVLGPQDDDLPTL